MSSIVLRRVSVLRSITNSLVPSQRSKFFNSRASAFVGHGEGYSIASRLHLSPLFSEVGKDDMKDCKIELVDDATWNLSSSLAAAWRGNDEYMASKVRSDFTDEYDDGGGGVDDDCVVGSVNSNKEDPDFDAIEDMRIRGNLFYKLDKGSREYEEYIFDFHRRKSTRQEKDWKGSKEESKQGNSNHTSHCSVEMNAKKDTAREIKKNKESKSEPFVGCDKNNHLISQLREVGDSCTGKKQRTLTFNQLTAPYHEPFCLDIYISKGSVRASIIHRATSNVVAVAHSISKDMKFDLGSTKNRNACAAVGKVLAQRALADDIHNVVYTPRTGEKLEGKLQIVLKSIIDGGVDVKVKLKQKRLRQARRLPPRTQD